MRLSARTESPFYYGQIITDLGGDPHSISVYIDGVATNLAVDADDAEGWADVCYRDESGKIAVNQTFDGPAIRRVFGRVEFSWDPA